MKLRYTAIKIYLGAHIAAAVYFFSVSINEPFTSLAIFVWMVVASLFISLPSLLLLLVLLWFIKMCKAPAQAAWILFLVVFGLIAWIPPSLFTGECFPTKEMDHVAFMISIGAAYSGVLLQAHPIHQLFKSFQHEEE